MQSFSRRDFLAAGAAVGASALLPRTLLAEAPAKPNPVDPFGPELYGKLRAKEGNVFLSPYSIRTALAMTAAGAKGATLEQMRKVLHLPADTQASDAADAKLAKSLDGTGKGFELAVANALWAQTGYPWSHDYKKRVTDTFKAAINDVNYADPEASRKTINAWVEKQTHDKIKDLLPQGSIDTLTRLVLTNAIYFKGDWDTAFKKDHTKDAPFTKLDGTKKDVPLMHRSGEIDYFANNDVTAIRLPYKGKEISFLAVLPKNAQQFAKLDADLTGQTMAAWTKGLKPASAVNVWLPRFKVETKYVLNEPLIELGMSAAFKKDEADFSGMVTSEKELFISAVIHKAFVDLNEEGTEAAAATAVVMPEPVSIRVPTEPIIFRADRPFLFALRHEPTGTLLFLGRYTTP